MKLIKAKYENEKRIHAKTKYHWLKNVPRKKEICKRLRSYNWVIQKDY